MDRKRLADRLRSAADSLEWGADLEGAADIVFEVGVELDNWLEETSR